MWRQTLILVLAGSLVLQGTHADLFCYSCQMDGAAADKTCLTNPSGVATGQAKVNCNKMKYCTIVRTEYSDPAGQIFTFYRGCAAASADSVIEGGGFKVFSRTCTSSLCNDGDGLTSTGSGGSGGSSGSGGSGAAWDRVTGGPLLVPGKQSGASSVSATAFTIAVVMVTALAL